MKPLLLSHYRIRSEPADAQGDETLLFTSEGSRFVLRGHLFSAFREHVVPLLDGRQTVAEIQLQVSAIFDPGDLERTITLLAEQGIVVDAERLAWPGEGAEGLAPQFGYLHEVGPEPAFVMERLADARVTVVGLGSIGAVAATALAAANVGHVRCADDSLVSPADPYLAQLFEHSDVGSHRAEVVGERIRGLNPGASVEVRTEPLQADEAVAEAIAGSDFVLGCLDLGLAVVTHALNQACLAQRTPWSGATVTAFEGIVGPTVIPYETACYRCYEARSIACEDDPVDALAARRARDEARTDLSSTRENLPFGAGIVGNVLALQAFQALTGLRPRTAGRILTIDLLGSSMTEHVVLRKPWCPACFERNEP